MTINQGFESPAIYLDKMNTELTFLVNAIFGSHNSENKLLFGGPRHFHISDGTQPLALPSTIY